MAKIDVVCPRCSETQGVIRNGHSTSGAQLYRCKLCLKTFQLSFQYNAAKRDTHQSIIDDEAIQVWYDSATPSSLGRHQRYSDIAITTVLVIKRIFRLNLRAAQGFIDSIFALMNVPLRCPDFTSVSKRAKSVNVCFKAPPGVKLPVW